MNFYIVVFDRLPVGRYKEFHDAFVGHPAFRRWFHYIKSCYIIGTELTPKEISDHFRTVTVRFGFPPRHLVLKVDLRSRQGRLPKDAWEWIRKNASEQS